MPEKSRLPTAPAATGTHEEHATISRDVQRRLHSKHQDISQNEHAALHRTAAHVEHLGSTKDKAAPRSGKVTSIVKKEIRVPVVNEVEVPVVKKKLERKMETIVVNGITYKPVVKYRDVEETFMEEREEKVQRMQERWVKVTVPNTETIKKCVPVQKTKQVTYTEFKHEPVEHVVDVPQHVLKKKMGYRIDKHVGHKLLEVEEDVHYEMKPVYVGKGEVRVREKGFEHHGKTHRGKSTWHHDDYKPTETLKSNEKSKSTPPAFAPPKRR